MSFDKNLNILFKKVLFNGLEINIDNPLILEFNTYRINGKKQVNTTSKTILTLEKESKVSKYNVTKKEDKYFKNGSEFIIPKNARILTEREINDKFIMTIEDRVRDEDKKRKKETQRDILKDDTINTYKRISSYPNIESKDIYRIKRYISFKSDMMFFYTFIDAFFNPIKEKKRGKRDYENFYEIDFRTKDNLNSFIEFVLNDTLKNPRGILENYCNNLKDVQKDFAKIKNIFEKIRHSLAHFDFIFIDELLSNKIKFDFDIKLLNTIIDKTQDLYYEAKKEFIEDEEINILDEEKISIQKLYSFYSKIDIKKPAFNKLINSFIIEDGIEKDDLKKYIKQKYEDSYFIDIHQNKEYKAIYNEHKKLIGINQDLQFNLEKNGTQIKKNNDKLENLKSKMNIITKENSLKRLEYKLRLAFGFIKYEYKNFKEFNHNFSEDIKKKKFNEVSFEKITIYLDITYKEQEFFHYKKYNNKTRKHDVSKNIFKDLEGETLKELVENNNLLKVILLFYIFTPKEIKGDFLGFVKRFYHNTKNISQDTKADEKMIEETKQEIPLKLKILEKNLSKLTIFNYSISSNIEFDKTNNRFYNKGNRFKNIYKDLQVSHNQDEFDKSLLSPLFKYYINLYKLINDFEIYLLLTYNKKEDLGEIVNDDNLKNGKYYSFRKLISQSLGLLEKNKEFEKIVRLRNTISHQNINNIILNFEKNLILPQREDIIKLIEEQKCMKEVLHYDAINDFTMKTIQLLKSLNVQSDKSSKIEKLLNKDMSPKDFYNIYKLKGVELIKKELYSRIGKTKVEKNIEVKIAKGVIE